MTTMHLLPRQAVDGVNISPLSRWVSSKTGTNTPAWLQIDLQGAYCVNQYILAFMGSNELWNSSQYNVKTFKIQGSMDGGTFFDLDSVSNNSSANINKNLTPTWVRYLRVYITSGLNCNSAVSSIVDFQASEPANAPMLSNLVPSTGALNAAFSSRNFNYSISVANGVNTIAFTPTAAQTNMTIKVNSIPVVSGQQTQPISLQVGSNTVTIEVTSADNTMKATYTVYVTRASAGVNLLLDHVVFNYSGHGITSGSVNQTMVDTQTGYPITVLTGSTTVTVSPTARDTSVTIKVNNVVVASGGLSTSIPLNSSGTTAITIVTSSPDGTTSRTYTFTISKGAI